jgi:hypothetical protein
VKLKKSSAPNLSLALIHHPVVNRRGEPITAAVTNLDLHDIARAAVTFGVQSFFVVTPLPEQIALIRRLQRHWIQGIGATINPDRRRALESIQICRQIDDVRAAIRAECGRDPVLVATTARRQAGAIGFRVLRKWILGRDSRPWLLLLGTAWGLADSVLAAADYTLEPVCGPSDYNHLSVRCAAAIILDRLVGGVPVQVEPNDITAPTASKTRIDGLDC